MNAPNAEMTPADRTASTSIDATAVPGPGDASPLQTVHRYMRGRYLWAVLLGLVLGAGGGYVGWRFRAPLYRAEALIYIEPSMPTLQDPFGQTVLPMFRGFVALQVRLLESLTVTQLAMETETWRKTGRGREPETVQEFMERRTILHNPENQHIQIQFIDEEPEVALAGVRALTDAYEKLSNEQNTNDKLLRNAREQTDVLTASRNEGADQLLRLSAEYGGEEGLQIRHVAALNQLLAAEAELEKTRSAIANHEHAAVEPSPPSPMSADDIALESAPLAEARLNLELLEFEEKNLAQTAPDKNAELVKLRQQIQASRRWIQSYVDAWNRRLLDAWSRRMKGEKSSLTTMADLRAEEATLEKRIEFLRSENQKFVKLRVQIGSLKATLEEQGRQLEQMKRVKEQLSAQLLGTGRLRVNDPGALPTLPFKDKRFMLAIAGGGLGFMFGVLLVFLIGLRDRRIRYSDGVGSSLPRLRLLGLLPELPEDLADPQGREIAVHCVHQVRTLLQLGHAGAEGECICITGPGVGSGKTTLSLALGLSFGHSGSRTLLIDADLTGRGLTQRVSQMLLSRVRRTADEAGAAAARAGNETGATAPTTHLLEPLVGKRGDASRPEVAELLDLLSRFATRLDPEDATRAALVAEIFALADLSLPRAARAELASRLTSLLSANRPEGGEAVSASVPPAIPELDAVHPTFNGTPLERFLYPTGSDSLRFLPLRGLGSGGTISVSVISKILSQVRHEFDIVLIDTGPALGALETPMVAAEADKVVFVVSPGDHRADAERSVARLEEVGARVAGVVFNRALSKDVLMVSASRSSRASRASAS